MAPGSYRVRLDEASSSGSVRARAEVPFNVPDTVVTASVPAQAAASKRPDIVAARSRTEAAARRIDQAKAGFYPSVNLLAFVGLQSLGIGNLTKSGSDLGSAGPAISLPIFNTERLQGQLRGAHAEYEAAVATYNATLSNALREAADAATSHC